MPRPKSFDIHMCVVDIHMCVVDIHMCVVDIHKCVAKRLAETVSKTGAHREKRKRVYYFQLARPETI